MQPLPPSQADLSIVSYSAGAVLASKEKRMRGFSDFSLMAPRFPVLLFFGICKAGPSRWRPRGSVPFRVSSPSPGAARLAVSTSPARASPRTAFCLPSIPRARREHKGSDLPLSGFPLHVPSIIGARRVGAGLEETKGKSQFPLEEGEAIRGQRLEGDRVVRWRNRLVGFRLGRSGRTSKPHSAVPSSRGPYGSRGVCDATLGLAFV
jgi:hypothetical protein